MKKIIVLTDFSEQSGFALKAAADLAKKHKVWLNYLKSFGCDCYSRY